MDIPTQILISLIVATLAMALLWIFQLKRHDATIADAGWAGLVGLISIFYVAMGSADPLRRVIVGVIVTLWSGRLCLHIGRRAFNDSGEDRRYYELRQRWKNKANQRFFLLFELQASLALLFSLPALVVVNSEIGPLRVIDMLAVFVWAIGFAGETLADKQLKDFISRRTSPNAICQSGLWRYSRHPNYFFEWLQWWSFVLLGWGAEWWMLTLIGPGAMYLFLTRWTGIPTIERYALEKKGQHFKEYMTRTNAFFPWFPR